MPPLIQGTGADNLIADLTLLPDGKILIGGWFTHINGNGTSRNRIARLMSNGSVDTSFNSEIGANDTILTLATQIDGKILIGGRFTQVSGTSRNHIARLMPDGSLDTSFDIGTGANDVIRSFAMQPNGKILIGGDFSQVNMMPHNYLARLMPDGSIDSSFDIGAGADASIRKVAMLSDGNILIGGAFTHINSTLRNRIARLILPLAAGSQVPVPMLSLSMLVILAGLLGLLSRYDHMCGALRAP